MKKKKIVRTKIIFTKQKKEKYFKYKEKIDENNFLENKNLETLYLNLDTLITEISSEREKNAILKYDAEKFNEKINELNNFQEI